MMFNKLIKILIAIIVSFNSFSLYASAPEITHKIFIEVEGKHTAVILSRESLPFEFLQSLGIDNGTEFVRFGWGDYKFYGAEKKNITMAAKALLLPTPSVIEVSGFSNSGVEKNGRLYSVEVDTHELNSTVKFIEKTFKLQNGKPIYSRTSFNRDYYEANGSYTLFHNCNNWTAKLINRIDKDMKYKTAFFSLSVEYRIKRLGYENVKIDLSERNTLKELVACCNFQHMPTL